MRFTAAAALARSMHAAAAQRLLARERVHIVEPSKRTRDVANNAAALKRLASAHGGKVRTETACMRLPRYKFAEKASEQHHMPVKIHPMLDRNA